MDRRATYPGERMIVLAEQRREWRAGVSAVVVVIGGSWVGLTRSRPNYDREEHCS